MGGHHPQGRRCGVQPTPADGVATRAACWDDVVDRDFSASTDAFRCASGGVAASWFLDARECAAGPQGRLNRPSSIMLPEWAEQALAAAGGMTAAARPPAVCVTSPAPWTARRVLLLPPTLPCSNLYIVNGCPV